MNIIVKLFAGMAEALGSGQMELTFPSDSLITIHQLKAELCRLRPSEEARVLGAFVAINHQYATEHSSIREGDEVALIPPVSGG